MGTRVINASSATTPLPYPLRGYLGPGESQVFNIAKAELMAAVGGVLPGSSFKFEEVPDLISGADFQRSLFASQGFIEPQGFIIPAVFTGGGSVSPPIGTWFRYNLTGGAGTLVLPDVAASARFGFVLSEVGGLATALTLDGDGANIRCIDGTTPATVNLATANARGMLMSDGDEWELRGVSPA